MVWCIQSNIEQNNKRLILVLCILKLTIKLEVGLSTEKKDLEETTGESL